MASVFINRATNFNFVDVQQTIGVDSAVRYSTAAVASRLLPAQRSTAAVDVPLAQLQPGAMALSAELIVVAAPAGNTVLGDVARVRAEGADPAASHDKHVVDFQGLRVLAGVSHPSAVTAVERWQAPAFVAAQQGDACASFPDIQTDRLRLTLESSVPPTDVAENGSVVLLTPPADLQLLVAGAQVWSQPGPVKATESDGVTFRHVVSLTPRQLADLNAAVAATPAGTPVTVTLQSSVPGRISLTAGLSFLQVQSLPFPEGPERRVPFEAEGAASVPLPIPNQIAAKNVALLRATLRGPAVGPARVLPPVGPQPSDAHVVLEGDRVVVASIPSNTRGALATLDAVRVYVGAGPGGAELQAILRADKPGTGPGADKPGTGPGAASPGDVDPDGQFTPATLPAGGVRSWVTLPLAKPRKLVPGKELWIELRATRGSVTWQLAQPIHTTGVDPRYDAVVRRALPSGDFRPLSSARAASVAVPTGSGMIRIVGEPPPDRPIPVLDVDLDRPGRDPVTTSVVPTPDGVAVEVRLVPPAPAVTSGIPLTLSLTAFAPIDLTVGQLSVGYQ